MRTHQEKIKFLQRELELLKYNTVSTNEDIDEALLNMILEK